MLIPMISARSPSGSVATISIISNIFSRCLLFSPARRPNFSFPPPSYWRYFYALFPCRVSSSCLFVHFQVSEPVITAICSMPRRVFPSLSAVEGIGRVQRVACVFRMRGCRLATSFFTLSRLDLEATSGVNWVIKVAHFFSHCQAFNRNYGQD